MTVYNNYNLKLISDYPIRIVYEDELDLDLIIELNRRPLNLYLPELPAYFLKNRLQLNKIKSIIIRISKDYLNNTCTIHFLDNIDLYSSVLNFEILYKEKIIEIKNDTYSTNVYFKER